MNELLSTSVFFGALVTILGYGVGLFLRRKVTNRFIIPWINPLLMAVVVVIIILLVLGVEYDTYFNGAQYVTYLLTPATVCLAIPLYEQLEHLKNNWFAIIIGITSGVIASLTSIMAMAMLFGLSHTQFVTLLPKSITAAIGMGVSEELGGIVTLTVISISITGILGNVIAESVCKIFKIRSPISRGLAIGTASHAVGTMKAMEMGEVEGAMSSLSIAVAGLTTVVGASIFAMLY